MVIIICSREDDSGLYDKNRGYLKKGIKEETIAFKGFDNYSPKDFVFNTKRVYDFTRSAKAKIRDKMATYLIDLIDSDDEDPAKDDDSDDDDSKDDDSEDDDSEDDDSEDDDSEDDDDNNVWPALGEKDRKDLLEAFDCLFDYHRYKEYLRNVGEKRDESMKMFVFDNQGKEYVARLKFSSTATRDAHNQFTVHATLTCQRYTYFPLQKTDYEDVCTTLSNLNLK